MDVAGGRGRNYIGFLHNGNGINHKGETIIRS